MSPGLAQNNFYSPLTECATLYLQRILDSRTVHESKIVEYLENLLVEGCQLSQQRDSFLTLKRFFARLCYRKKIFANPCQNLCPSKMHAKINIVAPTDLKKLIAYIQDDSSPSEEALTLVLIIFFGFKTEDLLRATIDITANDHFRIILHQSPRSCGKQHYNREQIFELPSTPRWLQVLKRRFLGDWRVCYQNVKQTYPTQRLILPRNSRYTRCLHPQTLIQRIYKATTVAIGKKISPKVLRQTCGDLHTRNGDGSVLTTLGWSPCFAFHYTWLPREIVGSTDNSTRT